MCFFPCAAVGEIIVMRLVRTKPLYHLTALTKPMSTGTDMRLVRTKPLYHLTALTKPMSTGADGHNALLSVCCRRKGICSLLKYSFRYQNI